MVGLAGGYALEQALTAERLLEDASQTISVTVPDHWTAAVDEEGWTPPDATAEFPALSAGTAADWRGGAEPGHGVFVGLLTGNDLPTRMPQHPECDPPRPTVNDVRDGDDLMTVLFTGCALDGRDDGVTVERVVHATANQLLWVQVRAEDRGTANRVLDSVDLHGM